MIYQPQRHFRFQLLWAALLLSVFSGRLYGQSASTEVQDKVVLVKNGDTESPSAWPEAEEAVRQELLLTNLMVETVWGPVGDVDSEQNRLQRIAEENKAAAAVRLVRSTETNEAGVELWVVDRVTGKTTFRKLDVKQEAGSGAVIDVAVRTVEALRASLLELRMVERQSTTTPVPPKSERIAADTRVRSDTHLVGLGFGGAGNYSPGGVEIRGSFEILAVVQPLRGLDIELNGTLSPLGKELKTDKESSSSTFSYSLIRLMLFYRFFPHSMFQPSIGLSGGMLVGWVEGRADNEVLKQETAVVPYLGGGLRGFLFIKKSLAFVLGAFGGTTFPKLTLTHGTKFEAARFGRPFVELSLTLQLRFL